MKKITSWKPDTCGCTLNYEWDTDDADGSRTHTLVSAEQCEHHAGIPLDKLLAAIHGENKGKNDAMKSILEDSPEENKQKVKDTQGNMVDEFIEHPKWHFDRNRKLIVELPKGYRKTHKDGLKGKLKNITIL